MKPDRIKPEYIFEAVHEAVVMYRELEPCIGAIRPDACAPGGKPRVGNFYAEFIADFSLCGQRVLLRRWPRRYEAFRRYYVLGEDLQQVRDVLKVPRSTFWDWTEAIKFRVGNELVRAGMFPLGRYRHSDRS